MSWCDFLVACPKRDRFFFPIIFSYMKLIKQKIKLWKNFTTNLSVVAIIGFKTYDAVFFV